MSVVNVRFESADLSAAIEASGTADAHRGHDHPHPHPRGALDHPQPHGARGHHRAPEPFGFDNELGQGTLAIIDTANGERMRMRLARGPVTLEASVVIHRPNGPEVLVLEPTLGTARTYQSSIAPEEPHEFDATLVLANSGEKLELPFHMAEPEHQH